MSRLLAEVGVGICTCEGMHQRGQNLLSVWMRSFFFFVNRYDFVVYGVRAGGAMVSGNKNKVGVGAFDAYVPDTATR